MSTTNITREQIKAAYAKNAKQLQEMADKAANTGRKINGFTAEYLFAKAAAFRAKSL